MSSPATDQRSANLPLAEGHPRSRGCEGDPLTVAIHQPNYFPYLGYFHKIASCDVFIFLDDVQYVRRGYNNRNRIKAAQGVTWLSVPVEVKGKYHARINEIVPLWDRPWTQRHLRTLQHAYGSAPYFSDVMERIVLRVLERAERVRLNLAELNIALVQEVCSYLGIERPMRRSSEYGVETSSTRRLIELVQLAGGDRYLSGPSGKDYMQPELFSEAGLDLAFADFVHPAYPQRGAEFEPNLSILDLLFNCGPEALSCLEVGP